MKKALSKHVLASALIAGLLAGTAALADDGAGTGNSQDQMAAGKNSCQGKKASCKGMAKKAKKKAVAKDKNSCSGKNGCSEKKADGDQE